MFEKVLVCLDGSPLAEEMLPRIAGEGRCLGKAVLVKVLAPPELNIPIGIPGETMAPVSTSSRIQHFQQEMADAPVYLEARAQELRESGLDVETVVLQGNPSEAIIEYARDNGVTLIAIATHGHSGFRHITLGSTAEAVLRHSGLPVLLAAPRRQKK
jgi:nucleotide-binding universal stress UspA family protein